MLIDSHAHITTARYNEDRAEVIERCKQNGIVRIIEVGAVSGFEGNYGAQKLAELEEIVYFTVGVHPHDAKEMNESDWSDIVELARLHDKVVGIGETGLDFYYNHSNPEDQEEAFIRHIELAGEVKMPLVIHDRDAHEDVMRILKGHKAFDLTGEFHCFSGDWELAKRIIDNGWYIGLGGVVTFPKAQELHEVARKTPLEKILLETDSPFLTPVPYRGKRNEPWYTKFVAERIAELKGISKEAVIEQTGRNAIDLFGLGLGEE